MLQNLYQFHHHKFSHISRFIFCFQVDGVTKSDKSNSQWFGRFTLRCIYTHTVIRNIWHRRSTTLCSGLRSPSLMPSSLSYDSYTCRVVCDKYSVLCVFLLLLFRWETWDHKIVYLSSHWSTTPIQLAINFVFKLWHYIPYMTLTCRFTFTVIETDVH